MHPFATEARTIATFLMDLTPVEKLPPVDAIFAFGHTSTPTPEHAARLYHRGLAQRVIVTGHRGHRGAAFPPGFETQGELFADVLQKAGVPESVIIIEKQSLNTLENVRYGMKAAYASHYLCSSLILVALPVHLRRCRATFAKQFPRIVTYGSSFEWNEGEWMTDYRVGRLVGEVDRLITYAQKGDTAPVDIPDEVTAACRTIRESLVVI